MRQTPRRKPRTEWSLTIPSDRNRIHRVLRATEAWLRESRFSEQAVHDVTTAVVEAGMNAIVYGNREDPRKRVKLSFRLTPEAAVVRVEDEGQGFRPRPPRVLDHPSLRRHGRGILLMRALVDEVRFEHCARGECVSLVKFRRRNRGS